MRDSEAQTFEFSGDPMSISMDLRVGSNPFGGESLGLQPVTLGTPMTIVVYVQSAIESTDADALDVVVRDCTARDVGRNGRLVALTDANGCVLQRKLLSPFRIVREVPSDVGLPDDVALVAFAQLQSFKFPDSSKVRCVLTV